MANDFNKAFEVSEDGITIETPTGVIWIGAGDIDPTVTPPPANPPVGSQYFSSNGKGYEKFDVNVADWREIQRSFGESTGFEGFNEDSTSSTTSNGWVTKLDETTTDKGGGKYYVGWSTEVTNSDKEKRVGMRVRIDDGTGFDTLTDVRNGVSADNAYELRSGFRVLPSLPANPGGYRLQVQFGQTDDGGTGRIRNVSVIIWRIGD